MKLKNSLSKRLKILTANNESGAIEAYYKRLAYSVYSCVEVDKDTMSTIKDFTVFENLLYGRVDDSYRCVEVKPERLVAVGDTENQYALPFVAAAYEEFQKEIRTAVINGKIRNAPFLEDMKIERSFISARNLFILNLNMLGSRFLGYYIKSRRLNEIKDFKTFMTKYVDFIYETAENNPLTSPAFLMSKNNSILSTGLAIDLQTFDSSVDRRKMEIIAAPFFQFYVDVATKFGFYIDKNYPCRLVANLSSSSMAATASENGYRILAPSSYFSSDYTVCWREDLYIFQNLAYQLYSYIQDRRPDIYTTFVEGDNLFTKLDQREYIVPPQVREQFPDDFWIDFYVRVRNKETKFNFPEQSINKIVKNAIDKKKMLDIHGVMDYINRVFMDIPAQEGSLNDYNNRRYFRDQEEVPFSDYQEYLARTAKLKR